jgi:protein-S-isoprenylcysteine O-methyltransferase Ste14
VLVKLFRYLSKRKLLSVLIEVGGVILVWRGIWGILDLYLFPNNPLLSYLICIVIGFIFIWFDDYKLDELK